MSPLLSQFGGPNTSSLSDEVDQSIEWKRRLATSVLKREHDDETLLAMLHAGLNQAHSEGLRAAAYICDQVASAKESRVAATLANAIRTLDALNIRDAKQ